MSKKSKAQRDEERRQQAISRMRLHTFIALLIPVMDAWDIGLKGGGQVGSMKYQAVEIDKKEARYVRMQSGKVNKARDAVVRLLGLASFEKTARSFYATADDKLQKLSRAVMDYLPEDCSHADELRVLTYLLYTAFYDLRILTEDGRPEVKRLVSAFGCLADYLLPADSPLVLPMNKAYYATRQAMQGDDEIWYDVDRDNAPQENWIKEHAA